MRVITSQTIEEFFNNDNRTFEDEENFLKEVEKFSVDSKMIPDFRIDWENIGYMRDDSGIEKLLKKLETVRGNKYDLLLAQGKCLNVDGLFFKCYLRLTTEGEFKFRSERIDDGEIYYVFERDCTNIFSLYDFLLYILAIQFSEIEKFINENKDELLNI